MESTEFYRGFSAHIRYCYTTQVYAGEISGMAAPCVFQADSYLGAQQLFRTIVDDYLNGEQVAVVDFGRKVARETANDSENSKVQDISNTNHAAKDYGDHRNTS